MEYIRKSRANRLELVSDFTFPAAAPSLKYYNSYTGRLRV